MLDDYRCPNCDHFRDSPTAMCDRCNYSPDPITDREPPEANARPLLARAGSAIVSAIGFLALVAMFAIGCGGIFVDNRIADRAIVDLESRAAAWLGEVIP